MWNTTGNKNLTTSKFPRLSVVPYTEVEWVSKGRRTPNKLRAWLEETMRTDSNPQKEDWELFFKFAMAEVQMDPNDKKSIFLAMKV